MSIYNKILTVRSIQLANLFPLRSPGVCNCELLANGLNTCDTALFNRLGVLLKENALLTLLPILQE